jgi:hypothetical protein
MEFADSRKGEIINGYKCIKEADYSKQHLSATFVIPDNREWSEADQQDWEAKKAARENDKKLKHEREIKNCLPPQQRHQLYSNLLAELPVDENTANDLLGRGFTQSQIEKSGFKTVTPCQLLKSQYPEKLPGINKAGKSLTNQEDGYLIPIKDYDGLIVGCQVRIHNPTDNTRYKWLNGWQTLDLLLPDGTLEKPLAVYKPEGKACGVALIEGTGVKPFLGCERLNALVIGASGGQFLSSKQTLKNYLNRACEDYQLDRVVIIYPDAGDVVNEHVMTRWEQVNNYLLSIGYQVKFAYWGQHTKQHDDIDELDPAKVASIQYWSWQQFQLASQELIKSIASDNTTEKTLSNRNIGENQATEKTLDNQEQSGIVYYSDSPTSSTCDDIASKIDDAKKALGIDEEWREKQKEREWQSWLKSRKFTADITINSPVFYLPNGFDSNYQIPEDSVIVSIKSQMGTGKTEELIKEGLKAEARGKRVIFLSHLLSILEQTITRANAEKLLLNHIHEVNTNDYNLVADPNSHLATTANSLHKIDGYFNGIDLYIDEICSVIHFYVTGGTLGDKQAYAMAIFEKAIREANRVVISDANNSDLITNFIAKIDPTKKVVKIENTAVRNSHHFKFVETYDPEKDKILARDKSPVIKMIIESGCNPFIASDSKQFTDTITEMLTQNGKHGYAINQDTKGENDQKFFLANPNEFVSVKQPDFIAISPTANSGVSITNVGKFNAKFSVFFGVLTTNQQSQILMRLRPQLEHLVFCPESTTLNRITDSTINTPAKYGEYVFNKILLSQDLAGGGDNANMAEVVTRAMAKAVNDKWFVLACELGAIDNFERQNLRKCLMYALQEQGHTVELISLEKHQPSNEEYKQIKEDLLTQKAIEIYEAEELESIDKANELAKTSQPKPIMMRIEKTRLLDNLPGIKDTEIWSIDFVRTTLEDREYLSKMRRFWMLNNAEISRKKSEVNWFYKVTAQDFFIGSMLKDAHLKIWALQELNILQFLDGRIYHKDSQEVIEFYERARSDAKIKTALGITIKKPTLNGSERILLIKQCLDSIGLKFESLGKQNIDGERKYCYQFVSINLSNPVFTEVQAALSRKYQDYLTSESVQKIDWVGIQHPHPEPALEPQPEPQPEPQELTLDAMTESEIITGNIELIKDCLSDNSLTWEMAQSIFVLCDDVSKKAIWQQLTSEEKTQLKQLQPQTIEEQWTKELIDTDKAKNDALAIFNDRIKPVATDEQLATILDLVPQHLAAMLTTA